MLGLAGRRTFRTFHLDTLDLLARTPVTHLHLLEAAAGRFGRIRSVEVWLASHSCIPFLNLDEKWCPALLSGPQPFHGNDMGNNGRTNKGRMGNRKPCLAEWGSRFFGLRADTESPAPNEERGAGKRRSTLLGEHDGEQRTASSGVGRTLGSRSPSAPHQLSLRHLSERDGSWSGIPSATSG
jgi:hypothetical protein